MNKWTLAVILALALAFLAGMYCQTILAGRDSAAVCGK